MKQLRKFSLSLILALILSLIIIGTVFADQPQVKNVILMIGDGMGYTHLELGRYCSERELNMDQLEYTGSVKTKAANSSVTDSAAAATALATGYKTNNGMVALLPDGTKVNTLLKIAQEKGQRVGLVSTTRITHATPAAFASHIDDRGKELEIAKQLIQAELDVLMGGGIKYLLPYDKGGVRIDGEDLLSKAREQGYDIFMDRSQVINKKSDKIFGVFSNDHMPYTLNRNKKRQPGIAEMTEAAIKSLNRGKKGFFLMIEGGRIDHASHENDVVNMVNDLLAFDKAVGKALEFVKNHPNTLLIVTADHETGGFSISEGEKAGTVLQNISKSVEQIAKEIQKKPYQAAEIFKKYTGLELTKEEVTQIREDELGTVTKGVIKRVITREAEVSWGTDKHTGADVPLMAVGPGAEKFETTLDNTQIPRIISKLAQYNLNE